MKKTRYIPYGYTVRGGRTVIDHDEAEIIRRIFEEYINGASLRDLADHLTDERIPYTEKTSSWDKSQILRIINNMRYTGSGDYDPIIDEATFDKALAEKSARQLNKPTSDSAGISVLRDRVRCGKCGSHMYRKIFSSSKVKERWICTNEDCGFSVRISDQELLRRITLIMNQAIENTQFLATAEKRPYRTSLAVEKLTGQINAEIEKEAPSEDLLIHLLSETASQLYKESNIGLQLAAQAARKKAAQMTPQENFNCGYFAELVDNVILLENGGIKLAMKAKAELDEGSANSGSNEDTEENGHSN